MQEGPLRGGGAYDQPQAGTWVSFKMLRETIPALSIRYAAKIAVDVCSIVLGKGGTLAR